MSYCKVYGCRFSNSHVTMGHICGSCFRSGHGKVECGMEEECNELKEQYGNDKLPDSMHCQITGCIYKWSHITTSHCCKLCRGNHSQDNCPTKIKKISVKCPLCQKVNTLLENQMKLFGVNDDCSVCYDNKVEVFLPDCGHACLCIKCKDKIKIDI